MAATSERFRRFGRLRRQISRSVGALFEHDRRARLVAALDRREVDLERLGRALGLREAGRLGHGISASEWIARRSRRARRRDEGRRHDGPERIWEAEETGGRRSESSRWALDSRQRRRRGRSRALNRRDDGREKCRGRRALLAQADSETVRLSGQPVRKTSACQRLSAIEPLDGGLSRALVPELDREQSTDDERLRAADIERDRWIEARVLDADAVDEESERGGVERAIAVDLQHDLALGRRERRRAGAFARRGGEVDALDERSGDAARGRRRAGLIDQSVGGDGVPQVAEREDEQAVRCQQRDVGRARGRAAKACRLRD